jgi:two-component system, OmpR family, phosphate regulon sensor histidine kinase PhoR
MENHANRPEVREARAGSVGSSVRHSATLDRDFCYVAVPFTYAGKGRFVLRLAVPLSELDVAVAAVRWRILAASAVAAAAAFFIAYLFSNRISRRIRRLQRFAENLLDSPDVDVLEPEADDELGALSRSLNAMVIRLRDLIDRLRIESSRREAILGSMVDGVLAIDSEMRLLFSNASFSGIVGSTAAPVERTPLLSLVRDAPLAGMLAKVLATGEPLKSRIQLPAANDRVFEVQATPLLGASRRGVLAIFHEITEIERLERVRKDFVANVSHELRTPLAGIRGCAETLLDGALEDPSVNKTFIERINAQAVRLSNISDDLLTLSELDAGAAPAPMSPVPLKAALETALRAVESEARIRGVEVGCGTVEEIDVLGHRLRLEQAFVNLLDNAVKFNRAGGHVKAEIVRDRAGRARITISDTGLGIPNEHLTRIFERFYRVDKARSRQVGGTGLGLAIVKHTVELLNGSVQVESELGKGSVFTVILPALPVTSRTT